MKKRDKKFLKRCQSNWARFTHNNEYLRNKQKREVAANSCSQHYESGEEARFQNVSTS